MAIGNFAGHLVENLGQQAGRSASAQALRAPARSGFVGSE
jgi:hypothetical protein